jgi:uncharacterized protein (TIGR02265 family)
MRAMNGATRALELVAPHCDLVDRLRAVPPAAAMRGVFYHHIDGYMRKAGLQDAYRSYFPETVSALPFYPLSDYMLRLATAGALVASPERLHEGMREIARGNAASFVQSLLGRTLIRLLSNDPAKLTEQGLAARRQTHRYGRWSLIRHAPRVLEVVYEDEFLWIESVVVGSAEGTYVGCAFPVHQEHTLRSRFSGSTIHSW